MSEPIQPPADLRSIEVRLDAVMPPWFNDLSRTRLYPAILRGFASMFSSTITLLLYVLSAQRLGTAVGNMLELFAYDFLGDHGNRLLGETDDAYRVRTRLEILRSRNTRAAIIQAVQDLTGKTPTIIEPANPTDTGAWNQPISGWNVAATCWGTLTLPDAFLIKVPGTAASIQGVPSVAGWYHVGVTSGMPGGYNVGSAEWIGDVSINPVTGALFSVQDVFDKINQTRAAGITAFVQPLP